MLDAADLASTAYTLTQRASRNLQFVQHDIAIEALHEFTGFSVSSSAWSETSLEKKCIISIAKLYFHFATVIICLVANTSENGGAHHEKMYNDTFSLFVPAASAAGVPICRVCKALVAGGGYCLAFFI